MGNWTDYDPNTGIVETNKYDELTGALVTIKEQDCTEAVDRLKAIANEGLVDKKDVRLYCSIPMGVQYELLWKHGINITKRDHWPRMFDVINKEYPHLKATHQHFAMRSGSRRVI